MLKILSVNVWPIASRNAIGYMTEHLLNNNQLFEVMEIVTNNVDVYANVSEKYCANVNSLMVGITEEKVLSGSVAEKSNISTKTSMKRIKALYKFFWPIKLSKDLKEKIIKFNPQIIYTQGYDIRILRLALKISKKFNCKLVIHTLDDWFTCEDKTIEILMRKALKKSLKKGISFSASPAMTERIQKLFCVDSKFIANCVEYDKINFTGSNQYKYDIIYTGNLEPSRYISLANLGTELKKNAKTENLFIDIFSPKEQIDNYGRFLPENIILHEALPVKEVEQLIETSKIALHVETFEKKCQNFIMYSLSTKIAEYLAKGKPIVYYGPKNVGVAKFLSDYDMGYVFDDTIKAIEQIEELISNCDYDKKSEELILKARNFFDKEIVQNKFYKFCTEEEGKNERNNIFGPL
ncbi:MAG: hypothetical protein PUF48_05850 [Oscillospiraceae bacterium]|nr:hypothetical protein [Oscillospiraceae bacterium]